MYGSVKLMLNWINRNYGLPLIKTYKNKNYIQQKIYIGCSFNIVFCNKVTLLFY